MAPQQFGAGVLELAAGNLALGLEDRLVEVAAEPALQVVGGGVAAMVRIGALQPIDQQRTKTMFVGQAQDGDAGTA